MQENVCMEGMRNTHSGMLIIYIVFHTILVVLSTQTDELVISINSKQSLLWSLVDEDRLENQKNHLSTHFIYDDSVHISNVIDSMHAHIQNPRVFIW